MSLLGDTSGPNYSSIFLSEAQCKRWKYLILKCDLSGNGYVILRKVSEACDVGFPYAQSKHGTPVARVIGNKDSWGPAF